MNLDHRKYLQDPQQRRLRSLFSPQYQKEAAQVSLLILTKSTFCSQQILQGRKEEKKKKKKFMHTATKIDQTNGLHISNRRPHISYEIWAPFY